MYSDRYSIEYAHGGFDFIPIKESKCVGPTGGSQVVVVLRVTP